jgi:hypothetical protein
MNPARIEAFKGSWMKTLLIGGLMLSLSMTAFSLIPDQPSPPLATPALIHGAQAKAEERDLSEYVLLHVTRNTGAPVRVAAHTDMCRRPVAGVRS